MYNSRCLGALRRLVVATLYVLYKLSDHICVWCSCLPSFQSVFLISMHTGILDPISLGYLIFPRLLYFHSVSIVLDSGLDKFAFILHFIKIYFLVEEIKLLI